jgi:hypothetical protein
MTADERQREAQRLMAILQGDGEPTLITECGEVETAPEVLTCQRCYAYLDDDEGDEIDGATYCEDCAPEVEVLRSLQVVCPGCRGKRLIFGVAVATDDKPSWRDCHICEGKGWVRGDVVERIYH